MKMVVLAVLGLCVMLSAAGHSLPLEQSQPLKEPSEEVSINSVESSGVMSQTRALNRGGVGVTSGTEREMMHPGEGFVKHRETQETSARGKMTPPPVTFPLIHGTSENSGVIQQSTRHAPVRHVADSVAVAATPVESQTRGVLGYPHGFGTGFAPIAPIEGINHPKPFLLPLAAEAVQSLTVLPVTQTYYGGQFVNPVVVPPETEFSQIVIKAVEPIERTIPFYPLQVQPVLVGTLQQASEPPSTPQSEAKGETNSNQLIVSAAEESQTSVDAASGGGPSPVPGIQNGQKSTEVSSVKEKTPPQEVYHQVDIIGENGDSVDPTHFSVIETSGKSVDKICFLVKKE